MLQYLDTFNNVPIDMSVKRVCDPPKLINGIANPVGGNNPTTYPAFIRK